MFKVIHDFYDKTDGTQYKAGDEYKGKDGDTLAMSTKFRPALVQEVGNSAKAPAKKKEAEDSTPAVAEKADKKPKK